LTFFSHHTPNHYEITLLPLKKNKEEKKSNAGETMVVWPPPVGGQTTLKAIGLPIPLAKFESCQTTPKAVGWSPHGQI
jgi:hypothetical protein